MCHIEYYLGHIILVPYSSPLAPPLFVDSFVSLITIEGQEVTLPCHTLPDHTLTFTWSFNGISISLPSDDEEGPTLLSNGSLVYASVVEEMEGNYTCGASNSLGTADGTVQLTVLGKRIAEQVTQSRLSKGRKVIPIMQEFPTL